MARIKVRLGENEIEVESRDFYIDNNTLSDTIENILKVLHDNNTKSVNQTNNEEIQYSQVSNQNQYGLEYLPDAETFEPEFADPKPVAFHEIKSKLRILETSGFFKSPRTVSETVQQLREYGWVASPLDVSKSLVKMASNREIYRNSSENLIHYYVE